VRPLSTIDTNVSWQKAILIDQDIDMASIAAMARKHQPGLLVVDRTVGGEYENYVTPEGHVPDADLGVPWETCMPMGTSWSWVPNEQYKSTDEIIRTLVSVVSRGGSLLLNVAPGPDGQLDSTAYVRLKEVGEWLKVNGEAVYGTKTTSHLSVDSLPGVVGATTAVARNRGTEHSFYTYYFIEGSSARSIRSSWLDADIKRKASVLGSKDHVALVEQGNGIEIQIPEVPGATIRVVRVEGQMRRWRTGRLRY
jgi:alpha-L-fucosidase